MVAFGTITTALAFTAATLPSAFAGVQPIDFSDNYVQPGEIKPVYQSHGYQFEHFNLLGGVLDLTGNLLHDVGVTVGGLLGGLLGGKKTITKYGHGVAIIGGPNHYAPGRVHHTSQKPFNFLGLEVLCCAADMSKGCDPLDCRVKITGFDKPQGGKKIYDHDFYIPRSGNNGKAPIDIDATLDGYINLGVVGIDLSSIIVDIEALDLIDVDVNTKKKNHGRYSYKSLSQSPNTGILGTGLIINLDLIAKL
ncbi:hypothetical protein TWF481_004586 [Arthrobotrys musiformis]|uniref:Uncharacterized protein n=1 Tax=Arthrobotrys musiformis TaxID=47236 RepID=A0AAV9WLI7_9PEZI